VKDVSYTPEQRAEKRQEIDRLMQAIHPIVARADTPNPAMTSFTPVHH
jgi:hypothetical protein